MDHRHGGIREFETDLTNLLANLPLTVVAATVRTDIYYDLYGDGKIDSFLPSSIYAVALDFLVERISHLLANQGRAPIAEVVAESREKREDALLQYEFVRLQLEGTQYASPATFRQLFRPSIQFRGKDANETGLQLADLIARPIADRVAEREKPNGRWDAVKKKLYDGLEGRPESYGLKNFPHPMDNKVFQ